jgi:hypothetical protein
MARSLTSSSIPTLASPKFQHAPLNQDIDSIRLIEIVSATAGPVRCTLIHTTVRNTQYTCLSYEWGAKGGRGGYILMNGSPHYVRQNLLDFLRIARRHRQKTLLWIDALCIDQDNDSERAHQVHLMGQIYFRAVEVWVWLGEDQTCSDMLAYIEAFRAYGVLRFGRNEPKIITYETHIRAHSYWTRAWVTQEIVLARNLWLMAGDKRMKADHLAHSVIDIPVLREARRTEISTSLLFHLRTFRGRQCSNRRDIVYSLLALCAEGPNIQVNYSAPDVMVMDQVLSVCRDTLCLCSPSLVADALQIDSKLEGTVMAHGVKAFNLHDTPCGLVAGGFKWQGPSIHDIVIQRYIRHFVPQEARHAFLSPTRLRCRDCSQEVIVDGGCIEIMNSGYIVCLTSFCRLKTVHLYCILDTDSDKLDRPFKVLSLEQSNQRLFYPVTTHEANLSWSKLSGRRPFPETLSVAFPLQLLRELYSWKDICDHHEGRRNAHAGQIRLHDSLHENQSEPCLRIHYPEGPIKSAAELADRAKSLHPGMPRNYRRSIW